MVFVKPYIHAGPHDEDKLKSTHVNEWAKSDGSCSTDRKGTTLARSDIRKCWILGRCRVNWVPTGFLFCTHCLTLWPASSQRSARLSTNKKQTLLLVSLHHKTPYPFDRLSSLFPIVLDDNWKVGEITRLRSNARKISPRNGSCTRIPFTSIQHRTRRLYPWWKSLISKKKKTHTLPLWKLVNSLTIVCFFFCSFSIVFYFIFKQWVNNSMVYPHISAPIHVHKSQRRNYGSGSLLFQHEGTST